MSTTLCESLSKAKRSKELPIVGWQCCRPSIRHIASLFLRLRYCVVSSPDAKDRPAINNPANRLDPGGFAVFFASSDVCRLHGHRTHPAKNGGHRIGRRGRKRRYYKKLH